jgi:uncharacterized protein YodC (DUF2158 family)
MKNKFKQSDFVKPKRGATKMTVVQYVNDPNRKSVLKGDKETGPPAKIVLVEWKRGDKPQRKEYLESQLELWAEPE